MQSMVSADMDQTQLEAYLTAQCKKRDSPLTDDQAGAVRKFWKSNKTKIHDSIVAQTMWGNTLQKVSWRIDLKSQGRHVSEINAPCAIMELQIRNNLQKDKVHVMN
jgi:hypothetical protein